MSTGYKKVVFIVLLLIVVLLGVLHYVTPGHFIFYHDTYRRLGYFPITIGGILFGLTGGMLFAILSCAAFIPHLLMFWAEGPQAYYSELSEILFYLSAGLVVGLISSRQAKLREKYRGLSEQLSISYQRLHEQTRQLIKAEEQLSSTLRLSMLGQVSASLAHEIKNPLAAIKGAAEILEEEVPKGHEKYEFVDIMRSQISRLNLSVEKVLDFCRGQQPQESGKGNSDPVIDIINRVCTLLEPQLQQKAIVLLKELKDASHPFTAPDASLTQVLMNILLNAIDAVRTGGKIQIQGYPVQAGYQIQISDNGPGIAEENRHLIFEPFITHKEGGTGLGLSISRKIIRSLGGTLSVTEGTLGGAGFIILLPDAETVKHKGMEDAGINFTD